MRYAFDFEEDPLRTQYEWDEYEGEQADSSWEFEDDFGAFEEELMDLEWEEELRRRRRPPLRLGRFRRPSVSPPRYYRRKVRPARASFPRLQRLRGYPGPSVVVRPPAILTPDRPPDDSLLSGSPGTGAPPESPSPAAPGSEYVRWVQDSLNRIMSLQLPVDGVMGVETRSAIRSFQKRQGLPETGFVGPDTERAITAALKPSQGELGELDWESEVSRSSREYIQWVQQSLNKILGLRLAVDGILGSMTRSAVRSFQSKYGLAVDGVVGPQTEGALIRAGATPPPGVSTTPTYPPSYGPPASGPPTTPSGTTLLPVVGIEKTSSAFREKVIRIARDLGVDPNYLMAVMSFESGFDPAIRNPYSGATGLIQFMPSTASRLGTSTDALARMSSEAQLDYVAAYFAPYKGRLKSLEDTYMAVLWPNAVGKGPSYVLFSSPSTAYSQNSALDINKDGHITVAEATSFVRKRLPAGAQELEKEFLHEMPFPMEEAAGLGEEFEFNLSQFPKSVLSLLRRGIESAAVRLAVRLGYSDENQLANLIFYARHPERGGRAITQGEPDFTALSSEWLAIRDQLVRPALAGATSPKPPRGTVPPAGTPGGGVPAGAPDIVNVRGIQVARQIASKLDSMLAAAAADGIILGGGGYRSSEEQVALRKKNCCKPGICTSYYDIYEKSSKECSPETARPGTSNHEKGLAIDFNYNGRSLVKNDPAFLWLSRNAARFGFYNLPSEPWHWSVDGR